MRTCRKRRATIGIGSGTPHNVKCLLLSESNVRNAPKADNGYLESIPGARGLKLIEKAGVPLIGKVAAGAPILAQENILGRYQIDQALFKGQVDYLFEVRGESMTGAGIFSGDWIGVRKTAEARSGQIAVLRVDDEVTVKMLRLKGSRAELHPANPDYQPIIVDLSRQQFAIEGIPVGLIRRFK